MTLTKSMLVQTNWVSFASAWTTETGAFDQGNATLEAFYARRYDSAIVSIYFKVGSTTVIPTGDDLWNFDLPPGVTLDTSKISGGLMGSGFCLDATNSANNQHAAPVGRSADLTIVSCVPDGHFVIRHDRPFTWAQDDELYLDFILPVVGWGV